MGDKEGNCSRCRLTGNDICRRRFLVSDKRSTLPCIEKYGQITGRTGSLPIRFPDYHRGLDSGSLGRFEAPAWPLANQGAWCSWAKKRHASRRHVAHSIANILAHILAKRQAFSSFNTYNGTRAQKEGKTERLRRPFQRGQEV